MVDHSTSQVKSRIDAVKPMTLMSRVKLSAMYNLIGLTKSYPSEACMAECGVFKGGSLKFMATMFPYRTVYGFDTFEGLPESTEKDEQKLVKGRCAAGFEAVQKYLSESANVKLVRGLFPQSITDEISSKKFCFVHLDMDQYKCMLDGLEFFYPRMVDGGIILCDDFGHSEFPGVIKALAEFFPNPDDYVPVGARQAFIVK